MTTRDQLALCTERYEQLLSYEKALRDTKARLGSPVAVSNLVLASVPDKIRYNAGETFDPTGMVVKVIYMDESEVELTAAEYSLNKTVLQAGDESVIVSFTDGGKTYTVPVKVNVTAQEEKQLEVLATPTVTVSADGLASWVAVPNATGYRYRIDDGDEQFTTETKVQLSSGQTIIVLAVGDNTDYADSVYSAPVTFAAVTETAAETEEEGLPAYATALIAVLAVALVCGAGFAAYTLIKKRKGS